MDEAVSARLLSAMLLVAPLAALAQSHQGLSDPTRPPAEAMQPAAAGAQAEPAGARKPVLQSVLVGKGHTGREVAVIDGEIVRKGDKFRGAVLEDVGPNEVVLRRGTQKEKLVLFPLAAGSRKK